MVNWKIIAWIFIGLFILETIVVVGLFKMGTTEINNKAKCSNEICYNIDSDAFQYYDNTCYCYKANEVVFTKYLG